MLIHVISFIIHNSSYDTLFMLIIITISLINVFTDTTINSHSLSKN